MDTEKRYRELYTRRDAIAHVSALLGGVALVGHSALVCARPPASAGASLFSSAQTELLDEVAETLLPETDTPGAKSAGVGPFVAMMVTDIYTDSQQRMFVDGLQDLQARCRKSTGSGFLSATAEQRLELLKELDAEQFQAMKNSRDDEPAHYFRMFKELALLGFFTSEIGYTQVLRYVETPGRYDPCTPYEPGDKAWARHG